MEEDRCRERGALPERIPQEADDAPRPMYCGISRFCGFSQEYHIFLRMKRAARGRSKIFAPDRDDGIDGSPGPPSAVGRGARARAVILRY